MAAELREFLNDAAASYGALTSGLGFMRRTFEQLAELTNMGPDDVVHTATGDVSTERPSDAFGVWTHRRITESCRTGPPLRALERLRGSQGRGLVSGEGGRAARSCAGHGASRGR